jgi:peptidoglycan/LPS O-acetylase OafA/YrhL
VHEIAQLPSHLHSGIPIAVSVSSSDGEPGISPEKQPSLDEVLRRSHLPALDGIRAISVLLVMAYHFGVKGVPAGLGVGAFFVLSGFLITWLLLREFEREQDVSLRSFYLRRALRIFPAYFVFVGLALAWDLLRGRGLWPSLDLFTALSYTTNYLNAFNGHSSEIAHAWSLAVEEQFYLLWPLGFLFLRRRGLRRLATVTGLVIVTVVCWRSWLYLSLGVGSAYVYNAFDTRIDNILVGCLLAIVVVSGRGREIVGRLAPNALAPVLTVLLLWYSTTGSNRYHYSIGFTVDAMLIAVFIAQLLQRSASPAWRWLDSRVATTLGVLSYPMYLYHVHALDVGRKVGSFPPVQFLAGTLATIAIASVSYRIVEQPFLRLKNRLGRENAVGLEGSLAWTTKLSRAISGMSTALQHIKAYIRHAELAAVAGEPAPTSLDSNSNEQPASE